MADAIATDPTVRSVRHRLALLAAAIMLVLGLTAALIDRAPTARTAAIDGFGFAAGGSLLTLPDAELEAEMAAAAGIGASWLRVEVSWRNVEPAPGQYSWTAVDRVVHAAGRHGLRVLGLVVFAPSWAQAQGPGTLVPGGRPADPGAFGAFAGIAAARYAGTINTWEVWNEPNLPLFFSPLPDVEAYSQILRAAYGTIHAALPDATVLSGGLAIANDTNVTVAPATFIEQLYRRGVGSYSDGIAVHPYTFPFTPFDDPNENWSDLAAVRDVMVRNGDAGTKIWITEFGAPTGIAADAVDERQQATILVDGLRASRDLDYTGPFFVYSIRDNGPDVTNREHNFGVLRGDFTEKPAVGVLRAAR